MDDLLNLEEETTAPRKRDRGERIVWTPEEDEFLRAAVQMYGDKTEKWAKIAACVPGRTNKNCRKRWFHSLDPKLKKGPWTEEEDLLLKSGVQMFKGQWSKIAERIPGRTDDQCAKRWREGLDPLIDRAAWTREDDIILLQRFEEFGSQWQKIALAFPGRPGLHCRNRWRKIQRGLNHMKRVGKRRSHGSSSDQAAVLSETRRLEALLDASNDDPDADGAHYSAADDILLMQDAYLDDDFALEHGLVIDENGLAVLTDPKGEQQDSNDSDDEKPYGCAVPSCSFESSSPSLLYYHFKASHTGAAIEKPFRCTMPGCETRKRYKNINGLQYHVTHAKNSPGHSGNSGLPTATQIADDGLESSKVARAPRQTTPSGHGKLNNTPQSNPSSPSGDLHILMPAATFDSSKMALSNPPTPAELQLQLHSKKDQATQLAVPHLTHSAFNIPHSPSSLEASAASSQASSGASSPQIQRGIFHCSVLGCDQAYHHIHGLNMHMTNAHGHRALNMRSNEAVYGAEMMAIPQDGHVDYDIDMTDLSSRPPSPMDTNIILLEDPILQHQLNGADLMNMEISSSPTTPRTPNANNNNINATFGMLTGKDLIFTNNSMSSLQSRMQFGNHIGAVTHESVLLQPAQIVSAAAPPSNSIISAGTSSITSTPATLSTTAPQKSGKSQSSRSVSKRFACSALNCQKSYATSTTLNNHIRNDHPDLYVGTGSKSPRAAQRSQNSSDVLQADLAREDGDPDDKPYKCLVPGCGKGYTNINGLKNHLLQTHGSTPKSNSST
ncbi:hypothetical protein BGZ49_005674 [Haplosporangium sp. Z 27]|nr:hypothetical protein BGZ49_005674 [Haplosporangium sp. Z 27]